MIQGLRLGMQGRKARRTPHLDCALGSLLQEWAKGERRAKHSTTNRTTSC